MTKQNEKDAKRVPELRFKGFADAWEQRKLGEIATIVGGGTPSTKNSEYWDGDINWYSPAEIGNQIYTVKSERQITELGLKKSSAKLLPVGTVLFTSRAGIGKTAILNKEACTNQGFQSIIPRPQILNSYFLFSRTNSLKQYGETMGSGSTFVEVSGKQMSKMPLFIPDINEQTRIAKLFQSLDKTITLHEEQHRQLEQLKKALLQKMFADETGYPVLRFKGFTEKWEQVELNDIAPVTMGQSPNSKNYTENPNNYILVQGNADLFNGQVLPRIYTTQVTKVAHVGDILMSVRAPVGNIAQTQYDVVIGRGVAAISGNLFIKQLLNKMDKAGYWNKYIAGSTFESVNSNDIKSANIKVPKLEEQEKIGQLFQSLDKTITLHDKKIQYLKQLKRGLLQKMFI